MPEIPPTVLDLDAIKAYTDATTGPRLLVGHKSWAGENAVLTEEGHPVAVFGHGDVAKTDSEFFARARADVPKLIAAIESARNLHAEMRIYDECGHHHSPDDDDVVDIVEVGLTCEDAYMYSICRECCTDGGQEYQTETCAGDHGPHRACWPCTTHRVLNGGEPGA